MATIKPLRSEIDQTFTEACEWADSCTTLARLNERLTELEKRVSIDHLTGLWNREHFNDIVNFERDRSLRYKQPVSLIVYDIDHFKRANDHFGHLAGDGVLRELALVAKAVMRSTDSIFRWGGEEFAVLATSTGYRGANRLAEALRGKVARHVFPGAGSMTISIGVAEHVADESAEEWFRRADLMLYAAKRDGRNCVRIDARGNSDTWAAEQGSAALSLTWQEAYESGEPTIDREHLKLFSLANALIDVSVTGKKDAGKILPVFDRLVDHIADHFANEERLLAQYAYAKLDAHRRAHASLLKRARDLKAAIAIGGMPGGIVEFLAGDVVARHLFTADRDFFFLFNPGPGNTETASTS